MIVGLGIDIVDIERIKSKLENNQKLKEHIFSKLNESEIVNEKSGKPLFNFMNESKKIIESGNYKILVSLSHTKNTACAVVILTN